MTVINGSDNSTATVPVGTEPIGFSIAVNQVTNKIYVSNYNSNNVTVIDGANNSTITIPAGSHPFGIGVNPVTNKVYVGNDGSSNVTVIDGNDNSTTTVAVGARPIFLAVNPVTNLVYVANFNSGNVTIIDGRNNSTLTVPTIQQPVGVAVNSNTNKIYVSPIGGNAITVIDGTNNSTIAIPVSLVSNPLVVNTATNKIYAAGGNPNVTVIDATNNATTTVTTSSAPNAIAVNAVTNKIYVAGSLNDATVITPAPSNTIPLNTSITSHPGNTTTSATPTFVLTATSTYSPTAPTPQNIYFQMDSINGIWTRATNTGSTAATVTANATPTTLQRGVHTIYFFATDGSDATSINPIAGEQLAGTANNSIASFAPESSPVIGGINAYSFLANIPCTFGINPNSQTFGASGGADSATVSTNGCSWTAVSNDSWITVSNGISRSGNGTVSYSVGSNNGPARTGTITIAGQTFTITQGNGCTYSILPTSTNISVLGGTGGTNVTTVASCTWSAVSNDSWITVTGGNSGSGNGVVSFSVQSNNGPARTGTITVAGQTFTVNQPSGCTYSLTPTSTDILSGAFGGSFAVTPSNSGCGWTAASNNSFITISGGSTGTGNGNVFFTVVANTGPARTGTITAGGQTYTVNQGNGCTFVLTPTNANIVAGGANSSFTVTTVAGCNWTAASNDDWIAVTSGSTGTGSGTVSYSVQSTNGPARTGTITAAGQTFTVNQASGCTYSILPTSTNASSVGGNGSFTLTTVAGCSWTAVSNIPWITVTGGAAGTGSGDITFSVGANTLNARSGTITAGGKTFTVNQATGCTFSLSLSSASFSPGIGGGGFSINGIPACNWTAVSNDPWITVTGANSGSGSGNITFSVLANTGPARTGTITAGGQTFTINQANGCIFAFAPNGTSFSPEGGLGGFNVTTNSACIWTAISNAAWITVNSGAATGNGSVTFTVQGNGIVVRSGDISVGSQLFTVNQLAANPSATVSGKVLTSDGRGLKSAAVSITDSQGVKRTAITNSFGSYTFDNVIGGGTYTISVASKRFRYSARTLTIYDNLSNVDFTGLE